MKKWGEVSIEPLPVNPPPIPPGGPPQVTYGGTRYKYYPWGVVIDDANETPVVVYDPVVIPHDILTANVISGGTGDPNDVVKISIIPAGLIEAIHEFLLIYRIKFDMYPYDGTADTIIEINIDSAGGMLNYTEAVITDHIGGSPMGNVPFVLDTHYKFRDYAEEVNAVAEESFTSIDINVPLDMFFGFLGNIFEVPCNVMVESEIFMADSNYSNDDTAWFEVTNYSSANPEDQMGVAYFADPVPGDPCNPNQIPSYEIIGEGFDGDVEIFIDGKYAETVLADVINGRIRAVFDPNTVTVMGQQFVEAIGQDSNGDFKRTYAYFLNKEPIEGDLDGDYDVDFIDFVKLADNWLVGTE